MVKKSRKLKVSIVIRNKNEAKWLKIVLKKISIQTFKDFEIIFIDNDSDDNSIDIAKKFKIKKIFKQKKYIPGRFLNFGVSKSYSEYIIFLSVHCIPLNKNWLKNFINFMDNNKNIVAAYGKQIPLPGTNSKNSLDMNLLFRDKPIYHHKDPYISNANSIYRTNNLKKNKFNESVGNIEDRLWAMKACKRNEVIAYTGSSEVYHLHGVHQHENESERSRSTMKLLRNNYNWTSCDFIRKNYFNYSIVLNCRGDLTPMNKIKKLLKILNLKRNKYVNFRKIFVLSKKKIILNNSKKLNKIQPSKNLEKDLKNIYNSFYKEWIDTDFVLYLNSKGSWSSNTINKLLSHNSNFSNNSTCYAKKFVGNFIVNFPEGGQIESLKLEEREKKPYLTILNWANGSVFENDYLRKGITFDKNTKLLF